MAPAEARRAHARSVSSVSGVANRQSSTTLSTPSAPEVKASSISGSDRSACAATIQRLAFHSDRP